MMEEVCSRLQILSIFSTDPRNASGAGGSTYKKGGENSAYKLVNASIVIKMAKNDYVSGRWRKN
jgi:hypothetical protein